MPKRRAGKVQHPEKGQTERQLAAAIRKAQKQPGLADLWELTRISEEAMSLTREQREASVATTVTSSATSIQ